MSIWMKPCRDLWAPALVLAFATQLSAAPITASFTNGSEYAGLVAGSIQTSVTVNPDPTAKVVVTATGAATGVGGTLDLTNNGGGGQNGIGIDSSGSNVGGDNGSQIDFSNGSGSQVYNEALALSFKDGSGVDVMVELLSFEYTLLGASESIDVSVGGAPLVVNGPAGIPDTYNFAASTFLAAGDSLSLAAGSGSAYRVRAVTFNIVPEPATAALLGFGAFTLLARRRNM